MRRGPCFELCADVLVEPVPLSGVIAMVVDFVMEQHEFKTCTYDVHQGACTVSEALGLLPPGGMRKRSMRTSEASTVRRHGYVLFLMHLWLVGLKSKGSRTKTRCSKL